MAFAKPKLNTKQALKLAFVSAGAFLFLTPSVKAAELIRSNSAPAISTSYSFQIAAYNDCINDIAEGFSVETTRHYVGICYRQDGAFYVGHAKNGNGSILLRLSFADDDVYVAKNGRYTYTLDMNKRQLIIKLPNGKRVIEKVINVIDS